MGFPDPVFMKEALRLAAKGEGRTAPNPPVGAVVVRRGEVVGSGWHRKAGLPHAEVEALAEAGVKARGADLYVTLEPCCHRGRTGPCTEALIDAGVRRVVVGTVDPNPLVGGKGVERLRRAGVEVVVGVIEAGAREVARGFLKMVATGKPFVTVKLATSLDGRIATVAGDSKWISGDASRKAVMRLRDRADAVLVGADTARADDPRLTARVRGGANPVRFVVTSTFRGLSGLSMLRDGAARVVVLGPASKAGSRDAEACRKAGASVVSVPAGPDGKIAPGTLLRAVAAEGVTSLLVEGGGKLAGSLVAAGEVDRFVLFLSPLFLGDGRAMLDGLLPVTVGDASRVRILSTRRSGEDLMVVAEPVAAPKV